MPATPKLSKPKIAVLHAKHHSKSTGSIDVGTTDIVVQHLVIIDGAVGMSQKLWAGRITQQNGTVCEFAVNCVRNGVKQKDGGQCDRGTETISITIISPEDDPVASNPLEVPMIVVQS